MSQSFHWEVWKRMSKVWREEGRAGGGSRWNLSHCPKLFYLWNALQLPPVMLIVLLGSTVISSVHCNSSIDSASEADQDRPVVLHPNQVHGSTLLPHHSRHQQHQQQLLLDEEEEDANGILYECPEVHYPQELEIFMESLNKIAGEDKENDEKAEERSSSERDYSDGRSSNWRERTEECPSLKSTGELTPLWKPTDKLLERGSNSEIGTRTHFRVCPRPFQCPANRVSKDFHWHPLWHDRQNHKYSSIHLTSSKFVLSNMSLIKGGDLVWNREEAERPVYRREEYCISRRGKGGWVSFKVCTSNCSDLTPCVRKCCPPSYVIGAESKRCIPANPSWRPIFYKSASEQEKNTEFVAPNASIIVGFPKCPSKYVIQSTPLNNFKLLLNGTLVEIDGSMQTNINVGEFCIDGIYYGENNDDEYKTRGLPIKYSRSEWDQVVIACKPNNTYRLEIDKWRIPLYSSLNCVSAVFLLLTDIVYLLLWRHQNIHGWLQFAYATSLFCTFTCFVVVQRWSEELLNISRSLCKVMGYITHVTYLSAFFWLFSMNCDLWWRFSRPLRTSRMRPQEKKFKRFLGFAGFSIGIPLLISSIGITLDTIYDGMLLEPPFTVPGFGKDKCYFENKRSQVPYLYGPAGVLLLVDLIFFTSIVLHLRKIHAHTELARTQSTMEDKKGVRVIAKLFIVMGVLWILTLASWIAHVLLPDKEITLIFIFIPVDAMNCLQGVAIFFIFVCKPNVGNQLLALFRRDDAAKTWNKQNQLPSVATVQQTIKPNEYIEIK